MLRTWILLALVVLVAGCGAEAGIAVGAERDAAIDATLRDAGDRRDAFADATDSREAAAPSANEAAVDHAVVPDTSLPLDADVLPDVFVSMDAIVSPPVDSEAVIDTTPTVDVTFDTYEAGPPVDFVCDPSDCDDGNPCNGIETCFGGRCRVGSNLARGTACNGDGDNATSEICVLGVCTPARCGDGFLELTEECDDGNLVTGDGCEPNCRYSCTGDSECNDEDLCSGIEFCDLTYHRCAPGLPLPDNLSCAGGGRCIGGVCRTPCDVAEDCNDGDPCNGTEICASGRCARTIAPLCPAASACEQRSCVPLYGCVTRVSDDDGDGFASRTLGACGTDCDDMDRYSFPGHFDFCDGRDNDCASATYESATTWYQDCDGDGFAAVGAPTVAGCERPIGAPTTCPNAVGWWSARGPTPADCDDTNSEVHPGATTFQSTPVAGAVSGRRYDYDCSGAEQPMFTLNPGVCRPATSGRAPCDFELGWEATAPLCGEVGRALVACVPRVGDAGVACIPVFRQVAQVCR